MLGTRLSEALISLASHLFMLRCVFSLSSAFDHFFPDDGARHSVPSKDAEKVNSHQRLASPPTSLIYICPSANSCFYTSRPSAMHFMIYPPATRFLSSSSLQSSADLSDFFFLYGEQKEGFRMSHRFQSKNSRGNIWFWMLETALIHMAADQDYIQIHKATFGRKYLRIKW